MPTASGWVSIQMMRLVSVMNIPIMFLPVHHRRVIIMLMELILLVGGY